MADRCVLCGTVATVRVTGNSFCSSCGLREHANLSTGGTTVLPRRSRRAAITGILSSGFLLKMLLGAVALATVSGVAVSGNSENAPGHDENGPGNSENAPGQQDKPPKKDKPPKDDKDSDG